MREKILTYRFARVLGAGFFIAGVFFVMMNIFSIHFSNEYYPKTLYMGIMFFFIGLALFLFPGESLLYKEFVENLPISTERKAIFLVLWSQVSLVNKVIWVGFLFSGILACIYTNSILSSYEI